MLLRREQCHDVKVDKYNVSSIMHNLVKLTTVLEECALFHLKDSQKMEAPGLAELSVTVDHFMWCYVPEDSVECIW
jgi:hypothetical protein